MFNCRTDLAKEIRESFKSDVEIKGVVIRKRNSCRNNICCLDINTLSAAEKMKKPIGRYVTIECKPCIEMSEEEMIDTATEIKTELIKMTANLGFTKRPKKVLAIGIGNRNITSDSIGPHVIDGLMITGHINTMCPDLLKDECSIIALAPGVMAQTGMETGNIIKAIVKKEEPEMVVVVDALACKSLNRINSTFQLTDTGITPGSGIGNLQTSINKEEVGVPVIAIGVPTVVEAETMVWQAIEDNFQGDGLKEKLSEALKDKYVTTKNIDEEVLCVSRILKAAINGAFLQRK